MNPVIPIILWIAFFGVIGAFGLVMLFRPSIYLATKYARDTYNPKLLASPWYRIELRFAGLMGISCFLGIASLAAVRLTGNEFLGTFSETLFKMFYVVFTVVCLGYVIDWIGARVGIARLTIKDRINQLSPEQVASLERKEPRIAAAVLVGMLLLSAVLAWIQSQP